MQSYLQTGAVRAVFSYNGSVIVKALLLLLGHEFNTICVYNFFKNF